MWKKQTAHAVALRRWREKVVRREKGQAPTANTKKAQPFDGVGASPFFDYLKQKLAPTTKTFQIHATT